MKKILFCACMVLAFCSVSYADDFEDELEAAFEEGEFEGAFESCFEMGDLLVDDPQCQCIFKTVRNTLSEEDYQEAMRLNQAGRYGSARRILKKALPSAREACF